ncbi:MAG TPA: hypothetical protein VLM75_15220 [Spirochaetota bacterium]|nr:hypothetical protein [Spirochaetota bacterium]
MKNIYFAITIICAYGLAHAQEPAYKSATERRRNTYNEPISAPFAQGKFVPDISLIADFSVAGRDIGDERYASVEVPGLIHTHGHDEHGHEYAALNAKNGFNFNYAELSLYSVVDPYFDLFATFHIGEDSFEVEEAFFTTRSLPLGLQLKAGKFLSSFGRINEQHSHYWDFANQPLVYKAFLGDHGLLEKGIRATFLAPIPFYLLIGGEVLSGENEASFGTEGFEDVTKTNAVEDAIGPELYTGYIKTSFDLGNFVVLMGGSVACGTTRINHGVDEVTNGGHAINGNTSIIGGDLTLKYLIDSYRYISLQSEYLYRVFDGDEYDNQGAKAELEKKQSGLYTQLILRFGQRWRAGFRYDLINKNEIKVGGADTDLPENLVRYTSMLEFDPSEFARIRLQYGHDRSSYLYEGEKKKVNNELLLQVNMAIGAHGAHSF